MSEYGSGLTLGQCCTMDKERIRHALYYHAKLLTGSGRAMEKPAVFCFPCLN